MNLISKKLWTIVIYNCQLIIVWAFRIYPRRNNQRGRISSVIRNEGARSPCAGCVNPHFDSSRRKASYSSNFNQRRRPIVVPKSLRTPLGSRWFAEIKKYKRTFYFRRKQNQERASSKTFRTARVSVINDNTC